MYTHYPCVRRIGAIRRRNLGDSTDRKEDQEYDWSGNFESEQQHFGFDSLTGGGPQTGRNRARQPRRSKAFYTV
jgi:hypothetical protein